MTRFLPMFATAAVLTLPTLAAQAQLISLQYQTNGSPLVSAGTPATAGAISAGHFNVAPLPYTSPTGSNTLGSLVDSTGATTTISETTTSSGGYDSGTGQGFASGSGSFNLYRGYALGNFNGISTITLTLSNLVPTTTYSLDAYVSDSDTGGTVLSGSTDFPGSPTYYLKAESGSGTYDRGAALTSATALSGNYFEFDGITGVSSVTFTLPASGGLTELNGFQLDGTAAPEPSSVIMTLAGVGLLAAVMRLRHPGRA